MTAREDPAHLDAAAAPPLSARVQTRFGVGGGRPCRCHSLNLCWISWARSAPLRASVTVIGASRRPGSVGRVILQNIITGGFPGPVYPVNPHAAELDGIRCLPSAAALPDHVDLAVIAVPAGAVLGIAGECGRRGVKALMVIAAGLSGPARAGSARAACLPHRPTAPARRPYPGRCPGRCPPHRPAAGT